MFQQVVIAGNLGKEPELKYTSSGKAVANFSVAVNDFGDSAEWFNVVVWEKTAENCAQYLRKGSPVLVSGRMQTRSWDGDDGQRRYRTELVGRFVKFLERRETSDSVPARDVNDDVDPDDLPF